MKRDRLMATALLVAGSWMAAAGITASAQAQDPAPVTAGRVKTYIDVDDPSLLTAEQLSPDSDSRRVVDSFLVSAFTGDLGMVYDTYLHPMVQRKVTREAFAEQLIQIRQAVGGLSKVFLTYLRETNGTYAGMDGGWTENMLVFERDPRVGARIDFRRVENGLWKITDYAFTSQQLERVLRTRAAALEAAQAAGDAAAEGMDETPDPTPPPQP